MVRPRLRGRNMLFWALGAALEQVKVLSADDCEQNE